MLRADKALLVAAVFVIGSAFVGSGCFPPPPRRAPAGHVRKRPPKPHPRAVWVKGHWKRNRRTRKRVWVKGHWKTPVKSKNTSKKQSQTREKKQTQTREKEQTKLK